MKICSKHLVQLLGKFSNLYAHATRWFQPALKEGMYLVHEDRYLTGYTTITCRPRILCLFPYIALAVPLGRWEATTPMHSPLISKPPPCSDCHYYGIHVAYSTASKTLRIAAQQKAINHIPVPSVYWNLQYTPPCTLD